MENRRRTRFYDQRLVRAVQDAGDVPIATRVGVPRSTAAGWLKQARRQPASDDHAILVLHRRLARLERRCRRLAAMLRLFVILFRVLKPDLSHVRFVGLDKARLLRAVGRTRGVLGLTRALSVLGLSLSRFNAWARLGEGCQLDDQPSCPVSTPQRLAAKPPVRPACAQTVRHGVPRVRDRRRPAPTTSAPTNYTAMERHAQRPPSPRPRRSDPLAFRSESESSDRKCYSD